MEHGFRSNWLFLIVKVLAMQVKFVEPFGCCTVINCTFILYKCFLLLSQCYHSVQTCKALVPELNYVAHSSVLHSNNTVKQCTMCQHTNQNMYLPTAWIALFTWYLHCKPACTKMTNLNWIAWNRTVWSFNCVKTNDWCLIELLVIHHNTWNYLILLTLC